MNILFWILQVLLACHTAIGALWKFSNSEQTVPSLAALPHGVWLGLSVIELFCAAALLLPALKRSLGFLVPIAAAFIAAEMLLFCVLYFVSGDTNQSQPIYWLVVAAFCGFIAYGRLALKPIR